MEDGDMNEFWQAVAIINLHPSAFILHPFLNSPDPLLG
jgi:hypothetical protein